MPYQPIENHGVIGDLRTVALVGMDGSIDFMCFPDFDSPTIFASLLDDQKGGHFQIAPVLDRVRHKQLYLPPMDWPMSSAAPSRPNLDP
jgi:GH15 family glucan-1,4-alpha-glucosidase